MELVENKVVITRKTYDALNTDERKNYWQINRNSFKLMSEMDNEHLQKAFCYAQAQQLSFHNKYVVFSELIQSLEDEAEKRNLPINDIDTVFHRKIRKYKIRCSQKIQDVEQHTSS